MDEFITVEQAIKFIDSVTYKPKSNFQAIRYNRDFLAITLYSWRLDTVGQKDTVLLQSQRVFPAYNLTKNRVLDYLRRVARDMETHEADEWLRVDGTIPFDPHRNDPQARLPKFGQLTNA